MKMESSFNEKQWILLSHLSGFAGFIFPLGNILGPLLIYLLKKDQSVAVAEHSKEALNFQISITIYYFIAAILIFLIVGGFFIAILVVVQIVLMIKAALEADKGGFFKYPLTFKFLK